MIRGPLSKHNILRPWAVQGTLRYALTPQLSLLPSSFSVYFLLSPDVSLACCALVMRCLSLLLECLPHPTSPTALLGNLPTSHGLCVPVSFGTDVVAKGRGWVGSLGLAEQTSAYRMDKQQGPAE